MNLDDLRRRAWLPAALIAAGLAALYAGTLLVGFQNDDYLFLEQARRHGLFGSLTQSSGLENYFRPLSREVWFAVLAPLSGGQPFGFHVAQLVVFLGALVLLADLLRAFAPSRAGVWPVLPVLAGVVWYAVLPFQRVNLLWVSCSQDLLALVGCLGAMAFYRRGRVGYAALSFMAATLAKESALPLPVLLFAWSVWFEGKDARQAARRVLPVAAAALPWLVGEWWLRQHSPAPASLAFDGSNFAAAFVHLLQSLAGIEHAAGWLASWGEARPSVAAFALLALAAVALPEAPAAPAPDAAAPPPARRVALFGITWCLVFTLPLGPLAYSWSGYYYTLAAVGGAVLVTLVTARLSRWSWVVYAGAVLWWHAAGVAPMAFAERVDPWSGTSHITSYYLERATSISAAMRTSLAKLYPRIGQGTRFFFATLPPWAGFQMGNGPAVRHLYKDDSLESYFYSAYGESTAARHPARFVYWDGASFAPLYPKARDPLFQVGGDLLLLDRPAGALWAFRRGLEDSPERTDAWYWVGWAALWSGERPLAERAWREWGARDDSTARVLWLRRARGSLEDGDTVRARHELVEAVRTGVGHPEAHAMLGLLLRPVNPKQALLESKVAVELKPDDWLARRDFIDGLLAVWLNESAAEQMKQLKSLVPRWQEDSVIVRQSRQLEARGPETGTVARIAREVDP